MPHVKEAKIAILATHGFEQSELEVPRDKLRERGATVHVISLDGQAIKGWKGKDWGNPVEADKPLDQALVAEYDALVLPGGQMNPDLLRVEESAMAFIRDFIASGKVVAAICHAPWLLIEAGAAEGREMTSYKSIATDVKNAGAHWVDAPAVASDGLITSRNPDDLDAFVEKIVEELSEGLHERNAA